MQLYMKDPPKDQLLSVNGPDLLLSEAAPSCTKVRLTMAWLPAEKTNEVCCISGETLNGGGEAMIQELHAVLIVF